MNIIFNWFMVVVNGILKQLVWRSDSTMYPSGRAFNLHRINFQSEEQN